MVKNSQKPRHFPSAIYAGTRHNGAMGLVRRTLPVSVAHRYWNNLWSQKHNQSVYGESASAYGVGSNLRVEIEAEDHGQDGVNLEPALARVKAALDHRCLFAEGELFGNSISTLEDITQYLAADLFAMPLENGRWVGVTVWELERFACRVEPGFTAGSVISIEKYRNLTLALRGVVDSESHLAVSRKDIRKIVDLTFEEFREPLANEAQVDWGKRLFESLKARLPHLMEVAVDLGCHGSLKLADSKAELR